MYVGFFSPFLSEMFEKALNAGFIQATDYVEIWQAYLDYLRRRVDFTQGTYSMFDYTFVYCHYFRCTEPLLKTSIQKNTSFVSLTKTTFSPNYCLLNINYFRAVPCWKNRWCCHKNALIYVLATWWALLLVLNFVAGFFSLHVVSFTEVVSCTCFVSCQNKVIRGC